MPLNRVTGLRLVADNLDRLADEAAAHGHHDRSKKIRQNAAFLRRTADLDAEQEITMGKYADKIHAVEKERDANLARAITAETALGQAGEAQKTLDSLTAAGKIADDSDVAALTDDPENAPPVTPVTPPADPNAPPVTPGV